MKKKLLSYLATVYQMWQRGQNENDQRYAIQWMRYQGRYEGAKEVANMLGYRVAIRGGAVCLEKVTPKNGGEEKSNEQKTIM